MNAHVKIRLLVGLAVLATLLAFGGGLFVHWPWLRAEQDRLEPAWQILIWFADAVALLWVVWFGVNYGILGRPLPGARSGDPEWRYLLASFLVAFGFDAAITVATAAEEGAAPARALQVAGQVVGGRPTVNGRKAYLLCRFQDQAGAWHESHLQVGLSDQPPAVQDAIRRGQFPVPVLVNYDPHWPRRCWLAGFNNEDDNRLHWMSFSFLLFQGICLPLALRYGVWKTSAGWIPLYKVIPLWAELTPFFLAAAAKFCEGEY
jgi:hypothetical protein